MIFTVTNHVRNETNLRPFLICFYPATVNEVFLSFGVVDQGGPKAAVTTLNPWRNSGAAYSIRKTPGFIEWDFLVGGEDAIGKDVANERRRQGIVLFVIGLCQLKA